jgi:hypothetical protein
LFEFLIQLPVFITFGLQQIQQAFEIIHPAKINRL